MGAEGRNSTILEAQVHLWRTEPVEAKQQFSVVQYRLPSMKFRTPKRGSRAGLSSCRRWIDHLLYRRVKSGPMRYKLGQTSMARVSGTSCHYKAVLDLLTVFH